MKFTGKLYHVESLKWMRMIRDGIGISKSAKAVALCLALYAKPDGTSAHPGINRLTWGSGCSRRTVIAALAELERLGLIHCGHRGSSLGTEGSASVYTLTTHDDVDRLTTTYERWRRDHEIGHPAEWS